MARNQAKPEAPHDAALRKAMMADFRQHTTDSLTPDRKYPFPMGNVKAMLARLLERPACRDCANWMRNRMPGCKGSRGDDCVAGYVNRKTSSPSMDGVHVGWHDAFRTGPNFGCVHFRHKDSSRGRRRR